MERPVDTPTPAPSQTPAVDAARRRIRLCAYEQGHFIERDDALAVERALEIHVAGAEPLITMRTPGADRELVAGLMHGEGVIRSREDIVYLKPAPGEADVMRLMLRPEARARLDRVERNTLATSACGVCGKPSFSPPVPPSSAAAQTGAALTPELLLSLPHRLRADQGVFESTGGLHAAGLFDASGTLVGLREDVGRHNALDKLIGSALLAGGLPLSDHILMLSGRASYELLQKSVMAGLPVVCAISAPSSYAVALAEEFDITLVGFLREHRFNVYAGGWRFEPDEPTIAG
ncbi:formate dehydrogenase accessory sulfurtransferase FdhD [Salinisphaera sp. T31B1]|uniref:formate dehydrogenase accessory sulfurtransferase FdhD n=1 Tax=Salinisphaera sp. T31B1 TaxID=727963 RepID=UPI003340C0D0